MTQLTLDIKTKCVNFSIIYKYEQSMDLLVRAITCSHPFAAKTFTMFFPRSFSINLRCPVLITCYCYCKAIFGALLFAAAFAAPLD